MFAEPVYANLITKIVTGFSITISCPFYILVIFVIYKNRKKTPFDSPFFALYIALGVVDIVVESKTFRSYYLYIIRKLSYWDVGLFLVLPYNEPNTFCKIVIFLIFWFAYMQFQLTILCCLNRFTAIVLPMYYEKYFTKRSTKLILWLTVLSSMSLAFPIWFYDGTVAEYTSIVDGEPHLRHVGPTFINPEVSQAHLLSWKIHVYAILVICTACYLIMFIKVKQIRALSNSPAMQREIRLLYPMTVLYICNFLYIGYFVLCDYWISIQHPFSRNAEWTIYVASDAYDLNNCYVIMLTSRDVRIAVLKFVKLYSVKQKKNAVTSTKLP